MLKKFKSLFVIEEEGKKNAESTSSENEDSPKNETSKEPSFVVTSSGDTPGQVQDKFLEVLFKALETSNQEGFDYMEYKDIYKHLEKLPMDDSTRYKSAFASAQAMGVTKEKILSSAKHYISILNAEDQKFKEALNGQRQRNLTGKQDEIKQLETGIKQKEQEIEKMKAEMEAHRTKIGQLETEIQSASDKLAQTASDFEATYRALLGQIEADVRNIETHL